MACTRRQVRTFFEVPCRNLPLTNPNPCNAFLCKHKSALHLPFWPFGPKRQGWEKINTKQLVNISNDLFVHDKRFSYNRKSDVFNF